MAPGPGPRAPRLKRPHASPHPDFHLCSVIKIERRAWRKASPQTPNNSTPGIQVCISGHRVAQMHAHRDADCAPGPKGRRMAWGQESYIRKDHGELSFPRVSGVH